MRELRVPRGMRKNAGQFIGIHFVLPHTAADNDRSARRRAHLCPRFLLKSQALRRFPSAGVMTCNTM